MCLKNHETWKAFLCLVCHHFSRNVYQMHCLQNWHKSQYYCSALTLNSFESEDFPPHWVFVTTSKFRFREGPFSAKCNSLHNNCGQVFAWWIAPENITGRTFTDFSHHFDHEICWLLSNFQSILAQNELCLLQNAVKRNKQCFENLNLNWTTTPFLYQLGKKSMFFEQQHIYKITHCWATSLYNLPRYEFAVSA